MINCFFKTLLKENPAGRFRLYVAYPFDFRMRTVSTSALDHVEPDRLSQDDIASRLICEKKYSKLSPKEKKIVDDFQSMLFDQSCGTLILENTGLGEVQALLRDLNAKDSVS